MCALRCGDPLKARRPAEPISASAGQTSKKVTFSESRPGDGGSDSLYFIFNFFETIPPPPNFRSFQDGFCHVTQTMQLHPQFCNGLLLKNVEPFDRFPYISYTVFRIQPASKFMHDPALVRVIREGHGDKQVHHQGGYRELHTIWLSPDDPGARSLARLPPLTPATAASSSSASASASGAPAYIVVGSRVLGNSRPLEARWREWSGADFILHRLRPDRLLARLRRISFYRRAVSGRSCSAFTHILLAEFTDSTELYRLRNFVSLMNARRCGLAGLYTLQLQFRSPRLTHRVPTDAKEEAGRSYADSQAP